MNENESREMESCINSSNNKSESQNHSSIEKLMINFFKLFGNKKLIAFLGVMIFLLLTIVLIFVFTNGKSSYYGTWDIHSVKMKGSVFTISELETMGDYSLSDFRIVIKEGGKAWIHSEGSGTTLDWEKTSNGIKIGVRECSLENELLSIENDGVIIYLSKTSDSQTISIPKTDNTHAHTSFNWQSAGNGCGARIPEPSFKYDVKASSTYLCVEVYNTTEEDFYDYVDECRAYGFNGTIGSATSPDLYYMVYDADEYYLEVFYYADEEYFYVYIRPPYDDSGDDKGNNDNNNDEITTEELLLAKSIAESSHSKRDTFLSLSDEHGYSTEKIELLMNLCDVDWNAQAKLRAENFDEDEYYDKISPLRLRGYLEFHMFTYSEIDYAIEYCQIDWVEQAFLFIQNSLTYEVNWGNRDIWYGPADIRMTLDEEWFDEDTIISVDSQIDWQYQVMLYVQHLSSFYPKFNRLNARGILSNGILANDEGVSIALETSGVNWKEHAFNIASEFYEENAGSWYYEYQPEEAIFEDMKRELLEVWKFTYEETEYAISKVKNENNIFN